MIGTAEDSVGKTERADDRQYLGVVLSVDGEQVEVALGTLRPRDVLQAAGEEGRSVPGRYEDEVHRHRARTSSTNRSTPRLSASAPAICSYRSRRRSAILSSRPAISSKRRTIPRRSF